MFGGARLRGRWAVFVAVVPIVALLVGGVATEAQTPAAPPTQLTLHLGAPGVVDGFHFGDHVQPLTSTGCDVSLGSPGLVELSATKTTDPHGAVVGRFDHLLGAKGVSDTSGATGRPCGEVDTVEVLRVALGPALANKHATGGRVELVRRPGASIRAEIRLLRADGTSARAAPIAVNLPRTSASVEIPTGAPFVAMELTALTTNGGGVSLASGTSLTLADKYADSVDCGQQDRLDAHGVSVVVEVTGGTRKATGTVDCTVPFNLAITPSGDAREVWFDPATIGWNETHTVTIAWDPEPAQYPVPGTRFSETGTPGQGEYPPFCQAGAPPPGSRWCIHQQIATSVPEGQMQVTETYIGRGDPNWLR